MDNDFSRVISLLRKERGISQKQASIDLGISQGLLSHYEKGKRECGLQFLVKISDYYDVSCDYLLGRSPEPNGAKICAENIGEEENGKESNANVMATFNKKLITNSLTVLFSLVSNIKSTKLIREISNYLMLSIYQMFRIVYSANKKNDENFFTVEKEISSYLTSGTMQSVYADAKLASIEIKNEDKAEAIITTAKLNEDFPSQYSAMVNLIKNSEAKISLMKTSDK